MEEGRAGSPAGGGRWRSYRRRRLDGDPDGRRDLDPSQPQLAVSRQQSAPVAGWFGGKAARRAAPGDGSHYRVEEGEIWLRNKNINTQIELSTPSVSAAVRGTELNPRTLPLYGSTEITVIEGQITASNPLGSLNVLAGEQVLAIPGQVLQKRLLVSPEDAVQWIVQVPAVFGPREIALSGADRAVGQEVIRLEGARVDPG